MTDTLRENLDLYCDGGLAPELRAELEEKVAQDEALRRERQELELLHRWLGEARIEVRPDFQAKVMAELGQPEWARREGFAFHLPFAALLVFAVSGLWLLSGLAEVPLAGPGAAVADFFQTTILAGAGMLSSSWIALGLATREAMNESVLTFVLSFVGVTFLDLWVVSLLAKPRRTPQPSLETSSSDPQ